MQGNEIIYNPDHKRRVKILLGRKPVLLREAGYSSIEESRGRFVNMDGTDVV